jgi:uncharacterized protein (TIRG00374 family)
LFVWLILRTVSMGGIADALTDIKLGWMTLAVAFFLAGYLCRIWRWRLMLVFENPAISFRHCSVAFMTSVATNNLLPFRAGDALRGFVFPKWLNVRTASVLASLIAERLMDLFTLFVFLGAALFWFQNDSAWVERVAEYGGLMLLLGASMLGLLLLQPQAFEVPLQAVISWLRHQNRGLAAKLSAETHHLFETLSALTRGRRGGHLLCWSLMAWGFEACVFFAVARAMPTLVEPVAAWLAMPVGTLATLVPSSPGHVGTFHYFVMFAAEAMGNTEASAAAFAVLIHLTLWVTATFWGGISALIWVMARPSTSGYSQEASPR